MSEFFDRLDGRRHDNDSASHIPVSPFWRPSNDFVICRDADGNPTAVYGEKSWNLNPVRLGARKIAPINFETVFGEFSSDQASIIEEIRYILFCIYFFVGGGRLGRISPQVLYKYFMVLRTAARFCYNQKANRLIGVISLQQLFTNPAYLHSYKQWMIQENMGCTQRKASRTLISHMASIGEDRLGYRLKGIFDIEFGAGEYVYSQHPVIPTRIYIDFINSLGENLDALYVQQKPIEDLIRHLECPLYGYSHSYQKKSLGCDPASLEPEFDEVLKIHGLNEFFVGDFSCTSRGRGSLPVAIMKIQWILKTVIHLYTGMRDQEVMRLPYECLHEETLTPAAEDDDGIIRDRPLIVSVLSTTTKFSGYRKTAAWLATDEVVRAIEVARTICRAVARHFKVDCKDLPLFVSCRVINKPEAEIEVPVWQDGHTPKLLLGQFIIQSSDFLELQASDPSRNFSNDSSFDEGKPWPLTTHQFRRSLAFYGSSSGFISLPSLRKQFKHLTTQMTRYYANNFEKLKTIFGYYDEKTGEFVLPKNHFLYEYQTGIPLNIAYDLLDHAFGDNSPLFGGVGSYISNQRKRMDGGDIHVAEVRKETERQATEGKISYRPTLLGACTTVEKCFSYVLGAVGSCLTCEDGIIEHEMLEAAIRDNEEDLALYEPGTGEYQVVEKELMSMKKFKQKFIPVIEVP